MSGGGKQADGPMGVMGKVMAAFLSVMGVAAALFWLGALTGGGARAVIASLPPTLVALFTIAHLPAMAAAILLWRAGAARHRRYLRWALFLSMVYFSAAVIIAFFGNFMAATILNQIA